ncbi:MAG: hypothetical protein SynsKO_44050 [Synoicihabitans sp.]
MISEFYIYCDGYDLHEIADDLESRICQFITPYGDHIILVNRRSEGSGPDLPPWDLGVNYDERGLTMDDRKDLILFFHTLSTEYDRSFVIGHITDSGQPDDITFIEPGTPVDETIRLVLNQEANHPPQTTALSRRV